MEPVKARVTEGFGTLETLRKLAFTLRLSYTPLNQVV